MDIPTAFAAVALAAVSWDGMLTLAGTRALRHALDYRAPYRDCSDAQMVGLMDRLLAALRTRGNATLMAEAAGVLDPAQRLTAYAVAAEIMRSDGPLLEQEIGILSDLAKALDLAEVDTGTILKVMDVLHASLVSL